ncbi:hypothetical protein TNCV_460362 [Trichonephila clavipes]|nr:hypothetical protein TNCV_460362 [Trichonephila clavipes]
MSIVRSVLCICSVQVSGKRPGLPCDRQSNTCLTRLASGHLINLTFSGGNKRFHIRLECQPEQASPQHILDCLTVEWSMGHLISEEVFIPLSSKLGVEQ